MKKIKCKQENGITLIALIITIIIMLILVSVSINILIKSDLFGAAQNAADKTKTAYEKEGKLGEIEIDGVKYNSIEEYLCSHEWGEWTVEKEATEEEKGLKRRTCTKCGKTEEAEIAIKLVIGATIDYKEYIDPSTGEAFTEMPSYTSYAATRGTSDLSIDSSDAIYTISEPAEGETGIEWVVIGEEDGRIKIKSKNIVQPSTGGYTNGDFTYLYFNGQTGYANFVNELNNIGAIYGKGNYAVEGRSMKMEDLGYGELTREASYIYAKHEDGKIYRYAAAATAEDIEKEISTEGGSYSTFKYMAMDANPDLEEGDEGAYEWKELSEAGDYVTMYEYKYTGSQTLSSTIAKADTSYFLASRYVSCSPEYANCLTRNIYAGTPNGSNLFFSHGETSFVPNYTSNGVCPVVYLKSDIQLEYNTETNSYTIID